MLLISNIKTHMWCDFNILFDLIETTQSYCPKERGLVLMAIFQIYWRLELVYYYAIMGLPCYSLKATKYYHSKAKESGLNIYSKYIDILNCFKSFTSRRVRHIQYIPRNMHTVFALLCFFVVIHWLIFPYPSGLLHWHCGNLTIAPMPAKQPWWIWINTSMWIHYERLHNHNKAKHNKTVCIFLGIYCMRQYTAGL